MKTNSLLSVYNLRNRGVFFFTLPFQSRKQPIFGPNLDEFRQITVSYDGDCKCIMNVPLSCGLYHAWDVVCSGFHCCHEFLFVIPWQYAGQMKAVIYIDRHCGITHLLSGSGFLLDVITVSILCKGTHHLNGTSLTLEWLLMFNALLGSILLFHHRYTHSVVPPQSSSPKLHTQLPCSIGWHFLWNPYLKNH